MTLAHVSPPVYPELRPGSFASTLQTGFAVGAAVAIVGLPDDTGVVLNNGFPGAAGGPAAFRGALARYGTATPYGLTWPSVCDVGDVVPGADIHETHRRVQETVRELCSRGMLPIGIGGGHDLTLAFVRGVLDCVAPMNGIYVDAHLDVREDVGSGMPFRRLAEDARVGSLDVVGLDPFANSCAHVEWFLSHGGRCESIAFDGEWPPGDLFFSFDLDAIDAGAAPGVSARNPVGMSSCDAARWALAAGRCERIRCFDLMELCPARDENGRTARLAARLLLSFLDGFTRRGRR